MAPTEMTSDEFKLLEDGTERTRVSGTAPLLVKGKLLGPPHRLDNVELKNVQFIDCDFLEHLMFNVSLTNVTFTRCAMARVRWEDGQWNNVTFTDSVCQGSENNIIPGGGAGDTTFTNCKFLGDKPTSAEEIDAIALHGGIGSAGRSTFANCEFTRINIRLLGTARFKSCQFLSTDMQSSRSQSSIDELSIEDCHATYTMDLSTGSINTLSIKNGSFHQVAITHMKSNSITLDNVSGNFDLSVIDVATVSLKNCVFRAHMNQFDKSATGGLDTALSRIGNLAMIDCKFEGPDSSWNSAGDAPKLDKNGKMIPRVDGRKHAIPYMNEWGSVAIQKSSITRANWNYSHIKRLALEDSNLGETSIAHSEIGQFSAKGASLTGTLDLSDARVAHLEQDTLSTSGLKLVKDRLTKFN